MKIGFIGLGMMGVPIAENLIKSGYELHIWNRSEKTILLLQNKGAIRHVNIESLVKSVDVLITMLADDLAVSEVMLQSGVLEQMRSGAVHICMGTISTEMARELSAAHAATRTKYISAPVLGRVDVAEAGKLQILAGGHSELIAFLSPIFEVIGQKTWVFGERPEMANVAKIAANFLIGCAIEGMSEASTLTAAHGVDTSLFLEMISSTSFSSPVYKGYGAAIAQRKFSPTGFPLKLALKDMKLAQRAAEEGNVPMPMASVLREQHIDGLAHGQENQDWASLSRVSLRQAGLE